MRSCLLIISLCIACACRAGDDLGLRKDSLSSKPDSARTYRHRIRTIAIAGTTVYTGTMIGLYNLWYRNYPQSKFHFFNDNNEWQGMDKFAHATTSYYLGRLGYKTFRWAGVSENKATWIGGLSGSAFLTIVEILDGFSAQWGASPGDLTANTFGSALFISQQLAWHEQKVLLKYSFHPTSFADYRPDLLGKNIGQQIIKDYNGHTYWLSVNLNSFAGRDSRIPHWLNVAAGYHATGMTGAVTNVSSYKGNPIPAFKRETLFYIAPDIDLTRIRTHSAALKWIFEAIGFLKFPLPALEISGHGMKFKPLYF